MKVVYTLPVRSGCTVSVAFGVRPVTLDNASVLWKRDDEGTLEAIVIEFDSVDLIYTEGRIDPAPAYLQEHAYRIANYIANRIYVQTTIDAIDPQYVLLHAPEVFPEDPDEEAEFKRTPRRMWTSINFNCLLQETFDPNPYNLGFNHSAAHGYYADALRAASLFQKFELLYKVIEYFFEDKEGTALDMAVSIYASTYDASFTPQVVENLRQLRIRSVHPYPRKGQRVNPENITSVREVRAGMQAMNRLAKLLLEHPTF